MSCSILSVSGDQRFRLGNNEILWQFDFGTSWQYIRIGFLYLVNMSGNLPAADFKVGINSGTQFGFRSASCVEYMGWAWNNGSNIGFTLSSGTCSFPVYNIHYKVGNSDTSTNSNAANWYASNSSAVRSMGYVDFIKKTANGQMTLKSGGFGVPGAVVDIPLDLFYRYMEYDQTPSGFSALSIAVNYNGPYSFDSMSLTWNDDANTIEMTELMVVRYA